MNEPIKVGDTLSIKGETSTLLTGTVVSIEEDRDGGELQNYITIVHLLGKDGKIGSIRVTLPESEFEKVEK
jgi:hypothetical protein